MPHAAKSKYLLPCSCGRNILIEATQAGEKVRCDCGVERDAPTMLEIGRLKKAEAEAAPAVGHEWGNRQRLVFLGVLIALIGVGIGAYWFPKAPEPHQIRPIEPLNLPETLQMWDYLRSGIEFPPDPYDKVYQAYVAYYRRWIALSASLVALGALLVIGSRFLPSTSGTPGKVTPRAPSGPAGR